MSAAFLTISSKRSAPARKSKPPGLFERLSNDSVRRGESGGSVWEKLNFMLFQWTHGVLSSFMTRVPLTCPSNGPFPRVSGSNASLEEPRYNQLGYSGDSLENFTSRCIVRKHNNFGVGSVITKGRLGKGSIPGKNSNSRWSAPNLLAARMLPHYRMPCSQL